MTWTVAAPPERVILSICKERRAAMELYAGLDVSLKRTEICVVDGAGGIVWRGRTDTHPEMIADALGRWRVELVKVGLETGSTTPWLARGLRALGFPVVVMDARRAADALKGRPVKTDRADARALAEMLQTGWFLPTVIDHDRSPPPAPCLPAWATNLTNRLGRIGGPSGEAGRGRWTRRNESHSLRRGIIWWI
jgi:hypothetical protein